MRLSAVRLENFRSFRNKVEVTEIPDVCILIGRNNAGKSNFIKALDWYYGMNQGKDSFPQLVHTGNKEKPLDFEIEFTLDNAERDSVFRFLEFKNQEIITQMKSSNLMQKLQHRLRFNATGVLVDEIVSTTNYTGDWVAIWGCRSAKATRTQFWQNDLQRQARGFIKASNFDNRAQESGSIQSRKHGFMWEELQPPQARLSNILRTYLGGMLWITPVRQATARIAPGQDSMISATGDNVLRVLNSISGEDADRYSTLMADVYEIIPDLKRIRTPLRGNQVVGIINEPGGVEVEIDESGSGLQQSLILVINLILRPTNSLLLIEEPEINLNAAAQRALFRLMKRVADEKKHQIVLTTHSTVFTETSDRVSTYLLDKKEGSSSVRKLSEASELRELKQALGHENTDLFGFSAVLIVEGNSEEKCLPLLATSLGLDLVRLGIRIINIGGTGAAVRIDKLLEYVKDSDTVPFVMLDSHSPATKGKDRWIADKIVKAENIFLLDKEFEDCFDDQVLAAAISAVASVNGSSISVTDAEIGSYRASGKAVSAFLERLYFERTGHSLSKPELGQAIGELLAKNSQRSTLTEPEQVLKTIQERLGLRQ